MTPILETLPGGDPQFGDQQQTGLLKWGLQRGLHQLIPRAAAHTKETPMGSRYFCEDPTLLHCLGSARRRPLRNRSSKKSPDRVTRIPLHPHASHGGFFCPFPAASPGGTQHLSPAAVWNGARAGVSRDVNLAPSARLDNWPRATIQKENCSGCLGLKPERGSPCHRESVPSAAT